MPDRKDYLDGLYEQYLHVLDERDAAVAAGEGAFLFGLFCGAAVVAIVFLLLSLFGVIL